MVVLIILSLILLIFLLPANFSIDGRLDCANLSAYFKVKILFPISFEVVFGEKKKKGTFSLSKEKITWILKRVNIERFYCHFVCALDYYFTPIPAIYTIISNVLMQTVKEIGGIFVHSQEICKESNSYVYFCSDFRLSVANFVLILFSLLTNNSKKEQKEKLWKKKKTQS